LQRQAEEAGAELWLRAGVSDLWRTPQGFGLATPRGTLQASRVIVTVGGKSWPQCGTTGDGYGWLERLGHTVEPLRPSLVPLIGGEAWSQALSGLTLERVRLAAWRPRSGRRGGGKRPAAEREGGFLFTHFGFSGPAVMDISRALTFGGGEEATRLTAQWLPEETAETLRQWFAARRQQQGGQTVATMLAERLPRRLAESLADRQGIADRPLAEAPKGGVAGLIDSLVGLELPVRATRGFEKAEVTAGGVRLKEIDPRTMESRVVPGLFIAGELLDLDGWIGGYNFQAAFSTGWTAGRAVAVPSTEEPV
jgi:predicted Rossmann fold flavoprotein